MPFADMSLAFAPAYPWSIPTIGPAAMLGVATALAALTVWTYLGVKRATFRRVLIVLLLRLSALALAFCILSRPSFAVTELAGVEPSKLLVVLDRSASMNVADAAGKPTRWEQVSDIWKSKNVERRLRQLAAEQKIEVVKHLGADDLRPDEANAIPDGPRTDIGVWLHQLWLKHGQEKRLRGVVLFSDGADNGTRFPVLAEARLWRGVAPIQAFGVGDPNNAKFAKDFGLTKLDVKTDPIYVKAKIKLEAVAQAPGFDKAEFQGTVLIEKVDAQKEQPKPKEAPPFKIKIEQEKDIKIKAEIDAPDEPGEYKLTVKVTPHPDETNLTNNEISTYVQVIKEKLNVLWVDRPRAYEPTHIIQFALAPEKDLSVRHISIQPKTADDRLTLYEFALRHYDVIVIGDITAQQFSLGKAEVFDKVHELVTRQKTGLLMLGGEATFANGGWRDQTKFMSLLPVDFDLKGKKTDFSSETRVVPAKKDLKEAFVQLDADAKVNADIWDDKFEPLNGVAPVGRVHPTATLFLKGKNGEPVLIAAQAGGRTAVFTGDSTAESWLGSPEAVRGFTRFWKQLVYWLADQGDRSSEVIVKLERRRISTDPADVLGFTAMLRDKDLRDAKFEAWVEHKNQKFPVRINPKGTQVSGSIQALKETGEYQLRVEVSAKDAKGNPVTPKAGARFLVANDDLETLRPLAEHGTLARIAAAAEGRFQLADEAAFLLFLEELQGQVDRESRHRTTNWPDWNRLPASEHARDQLSGMWNSFALVGLMLFVTLLGAEWLLRRMWGLV